MVSTSYLVAFLGAAFAVEFRFTNRCNYTIELHGGGSVPLCDLAPGETVGNNCNTSLKDHGLFKHTASNEANLLEYSIINSPGYNSVWYDVSNIPPGPGNCMSFDLCKAETNKTGYNVPMLVEPTKYDNGQNCRSLNVTRDDAPDAYLYPSDDLKTHNCPMAEIFNVTFCHPETS
ncbi:hypothetical protein SDRG_11681 [Saprolegnia diclina VS20]|uniref:Uncharacterized protein n=1 Tax=Saprolegnia diclina (strain VS20) TaxID=1156394 RepID=T0Q7M1_SAPDV|nr:hypothetical protein SDRG_11681 [Saprolegnia diclina VS20]EQC30626.1 hypothetical protein SDRG_11681 [Saprolegnia diclina VS20]|eukprot:XP_008615952.1 hypothetical protein SDRG_11681 [Saprolegnia diclina VS20]